MGARSHSRRIERRLRGRGGGRPGAGLARLRHRRLDPPAGLALRRRRLQADLRPRLALRPARLRLVARSDRPVRADRAGRRRRLRGDGRPRRRRRHDGARRRARPVRARAADAARRARRSPAAASVCRAPCSASGVDAAVQAAIDAALAVLEQLGATLVDVALPHASAAIPVYYLVATAEASSNLARYDGVRYTARAKLAPGDDLAALYDRTRGEHFGAEVKRRIMLGTYVLSAGYYEAYYLKAQQVRTLIRRDYERRVRRRRGRDRDADVSDAGVPARRARRRSAADVPGRRVHGQRQPDRAAGDQRAVRVLAGSPADRPAADRPAVRRGRPAAASPTPTSRRRRGTARMPSRSERPCAAVGVDSRRRASSTRS